MSKSSKLTRYWIEHYIDPAALVCVLCGNKGVVDTQSVTTPAGIPINTMHVYCFCPNGRAMRSASEHGDVSA
jgi:hypothetical protein